MKIPTKYLLTSLFAFFLLTGFTCSKHVPVAESKKETNTEAPSTTESSPQDNMTDQAPTSSTEQTPNQ